MLTFVTLAEPMVPDPLPTLQVSPSGGVCTATEYAAPPASGVANTKFSLVALLVFVNVSASPPLSRSVMEVPLDDRLGENLRLNGAAHHLDSVVRRTMLEPRRLRARGVSK